MRVSLTEPLVIRFDGKDVTKSKDINLFIIHPPLYFFIYS